MTVLIVAHGSKVEQTNEIMLSYMKALREKSTQNFEMCYLQLMNPLLEEAVTKIYESGERHIRLFPFFIFNGNHIISDIPNEIEALKHKYPDLVIEYLENIGFDPKIVEIIIERTSNA